MSKLETALHTPPRLSHSRDVIVRSCSAPDSFKLLQEMSGLGITVRLWFQFEVDLMFGCPICRTQVCPKLIQFPLLLDYPTGFNPNWLDLELSR